MVFWCRLASGPLCVVLMMAVDEAASLSITQTEWQEKSSDDVLTSDPAMAKLGKGAGSFIDAELEADFQAKSKKLKEVMKKFMETKQEMEEAKATANEAMKKVKEEAERRRVILKAKQAREEADLKATQVSQRKVKEEAMARARALVGPAFGSVSQLLGQVTVENLVDILITLPSAIQNGKFMRIFGDATREVKRNVKEFLNITTKRTSQFVSASTSASDVELAFLMAKFFHESGYRLKALHKDTEKIIKELRFGVPDDLKKALGPILVSLKENTVPLHVNATDLASATPAEACEQVSGIMSNISDYDSKLVTVGMVIQNITSAMLPGLSNVMQVSPNVTQFVGSFLNLAQLEVAGLQEASHNIVVKVGPIVAERIQCTWSAAHPRFGLGFLSACVALASGWALL